MAEGRRGAWSQAGWRWPDVCWLGSVCMVLFQFTHSLENVTSTHKSTVLPKNYVITPQTCFCFRVSTPPVPGLVPHPGESLPGILCLTFPCLLKRRPFSTSDRVGSCLWEPHPWGPCTRRGPGHRFALPLPAGTAPAQLPGSLCRVRGRYCLYHWQLSLPKPTHSLNSLPALPALDSARAEPQPGTSRGPSTLHP